jgi:hypothetical protein
MAMSSDNGIETAVMMVDRSESRKTRITITAKRSPSPPSTDHRRLVEDDRERSAVAEFALELGQGRPDRVGDLDGVGVGALQHRDAQRGEAVCARDRGHGGRDEFDIGHRRQGERAVLMLDRQRRQVVERGDRAADLDRECDTVAHARAGGDDDTARGDRRGDLFT